MNKLLIALQRNFGQPFDNIEKNSGFTENNERSKKMGNTVTCSAEPSINQVLQNAAYSI